MTLVDAYVERKTEEVMRDTWGHLDAEKDVRHHGTIVFAEGEFGGERIILSSDFGDDAGFGPWFYEGIHGWLYDQETEPRVVYRFVGWYELTAGGDHIFAGATTTINLDIGAKR